MDPNSTVIPPEGTRIYRFAYKLSVEVFLVVLVLGYGFLVSEMILPGFLSSRLHFAVVYGGALAFLAGIIWTGRRVGGIPPTSGPPPHFKGALAAGGGLALFLALGAKNLTGLNLGGVMVLTALVGGLLLWEFWPFAAQRMGGRSTEKNPLV